MTAIQKPFLMWIGETFYKTIDEWVDEVKEQGVSKRVPSLGVAESMTSDGAVVFVAHDEGEHVDCPTCHAIVKCEVCGGSGHVVEHPAGCVVETCPACDGVGMIEGSTGGSIKVDGKTWRFRFYLTQAKQPAIFKKGEHAIEAKNVCSKCGGSGRLPKGKVFGVFVPAGIDYILRDEDDEVLKAKLAEKKVKTVTKEIRAKELVRKCGIRKGGGYYVVTTTVTDDSVRAEEVARELVDQGVLNPDGFEVHGTFIRFLAPVDITGVKRFRGVKRWNMTPDAEAEAEVAVEAVA